MARYVLEYKRTKVHFGPRANDVDVGKRTFSTLKEVRSYAYVSPGRLGFAMSDYEGYIRDLNTGKIVAAIDGDRYVYKQDGKLYCRFMNKGGALDSYYGKMEYHGKYKF